MKFGMSKMDVINDLVQTEHGFLQKMPDLYLMVYYSKQAKLCLKPILKTNLIEYIIKINRSSTSFHVILFVALYG